MMEERNIKGGGGAIINKADRSRKRKERIGQSHRRSDEENKKTQNTHRQTDGRRI